MTNGGIDTETWLWGYRLFTTGNWELRPVFRHVISEFKILNHEILKSFTDKLPNGGSL